MFGVEFYPTPESLINKIFEDFDIKIGRAYKRNEEPVFYKDILEPSAGKGNIVDYLTQKDKYGRDRTPEIDCIEIDENLRNVLKGKEYRVIYDDFLKFFTLKHYDLIVMNPPFSNGDEHLLKALSLIKDGGDVICILNAETIKNPYTKRRKVLCQKLKELNADIKLYNAAFSDAERQTEVMVAAVFVHIPNKVLESEFLNQMKKKNYEEYHSKDCTDVAFPDSIKNAILQYNIDIETGIKLIKEYRALSDTFKNSFTSEYYSPIIEMKIRDKYEVTVNEYVRAVRYKYWEALFKNPDFTRQMTSNLQSKYSSKIDELKDYDFNEYNIREIKYDITKNLIKGVEDCIIDLFDELSRQYSWYDNSENIHYYNGWKTNKSWIINKKVVMPYDAFEDVWDYEGYRKVSKPRRLEFGYSFRQKLSDIEKVLNYLDDGSAIPINMDWQIENAKNNDITKNIRLKHFSITVFKKGTCHITFNNEELLKKFNIFGSQHKGWLPPSYGKKTYDEMNEEEKEVIDEFEGKESYEKTLLRKDYFLAGAESMLMLTDGVSNSEKIA